MVRPHQFKWKSMSGARYLINDYMELRTNGWEGFYKRGHLVWLF